MYPAPIAAGNMKHVYTKKNTPGATLAYITRQEELIAEQSHKTAKVGARILIRGKVLTQFTSLAQEDMRNEMEEEEEEEEEDETIEPPSEDGPPLMNLRVHDEIDDFFNPRSDRLEEDSANSQYTYSSPPS